MRSRINLLAAACALLHDLSDDYNAGRIEHFKTPGYSYRNRKPALAGFTMMRLASDAECSKEAVYYHWPTKNALLFDVVDSGCESVEAVLRGADELRFVGLAAMHFARVIPAALLDADANLPKAVRYRIDRCVGRIRARARATIRKHHIKLGARREEIDAFAEAVALMMVAACTATTCHTHHAPHAQRSAVIRQAVNFSYTLSRR